MRILDGQIRGTGRQALRSPVRLGTLSWAPPQLALCHAMISD